MTVIVWYQNLNSRVYFKVIHVRKAEFTKVSESGVSRNHVTNISFSFLDTYNIWDNDISILVLAFLVGKWVHFSHSITWVALLSLPLHTHHGHFRFLGGDQISGSCGKRQKVFLKYSMKCCWCIFVYTFCSVSTVTRLFSSCQKCGSDTKANWIRILEKLQISHNKLYTCLFLFMLSLNRVKPF